MARPTQRPNYSHSEGYINDSAYGSQIYFTINDNDYRFKNVCSKMCAYSTKLGLIALINRID